MEEAYNLSVEINNNLKDYDTKLRPNAGGESVCNCDKLGCWAAIYIPTRQHVSCGTAFSWLMTTSVFVQKQNKR